MGQALPKVVPNTQAAPQPLEQITIHYAQTKLEKERIYRFRHQVYVEEMGKRLNEGDAKRRLLYDDMDFDDMHVLIYARTSSEIVGTMRVHLGLAKDFSSDLIEAFDMEKFQSFAPNQPLAFNSKAMVAPHYRRSQAFYLLSAAVYDEMRRRGTHFNFTGGATYMTALYEQLGHQRYKSNFPVPDYGYMVPMVFLMEDINHLRDVRSPLWRLARKMDNSPASAEWFASAFPNMSRYVNRQLISKDELWQLIITKLGNSPEQRIPLFHGLNEAEAKLCADAGHIILCDQGHTIVQPQDMGNETLLVLTGALAVRNQLASRRKPVTVLKPGATFGEQTMLAHARQNATVIAQTDTELLVLPRHALDRLRLQHPEVAAKLFQNIGKTDAETYTYA